MVSNKEVYLFIYLLIYLIISLSWGAPGNYNDYQKIYRALQALKFKWLLSLSR